MKYKPIEKIDCWICGKPASKTSRHSVFIDERYRCYCRECFKKVIDEYEKENELFIYLKHKRMLEKALLILENQQVNMYKYKEAIDAVSDHLKENPDKYDSSYEILAAIILIQNRIKVKMQYHVGKYCVDMFLPEMNIILEIDGERHRSNSTKDTKRDAEIKNIMERKVDIVRIKTDFLDENAQRLPKAIEYVHKYHCEGKIDWKNLKG